MTWWKRTHRRRTRLRGQSLHPETFLYNLGRKVCHSILYLAWFLTDQQGSRRRHTSLIALPYTLTTIAIPKYQYDIYKSVTRRKRTRRKSTRCKRTRFRKWLDLNAHDPSVYVFEIFKLRCKTFNTKLKD